MVYEWDEDKNQLNISKHGLDFDQVVRIFDGLTLTLVSNNKDYGETREKSLGILDGRGVIAVIHTDRNGRMRIISARFASRTERKIYDAFRARKQTH